MIFSAKSKTFLVGEYSVLFGGSAILLATNPEFKLQAMENAPDAFLVGIKKESPAHRFYMAHKNVFQNLFIEFIDPFNGSGGLGASSAQFTLLYELYLYMTKHEFDISSFLEEYKMLAGGENCVLKPSGADCVVQYYNHNIFFETHSNHVQKIEWNFPNVDFAIFKTGFKVATHQHLQQLNSMDVSELESCTLNVRQSFMNQDERSLVKNVQDFFAILKVMGLVLPQISNLVDDFLKVDGVLAAKGCGAMSADTICVIFRKEQKNHIKKTACNFGLQEI